MAVVEAARSLLAALGVFDPALMSGEDAAVVVEELARVEKACAASRALAAVRAADCGRQVTRGHRRAVDWLAEVTGSSVGQARAALEVAEKLGGLEATRAAAVAGEVSLHQAGVIARTEAVAPGHEAELVSLAGRSGLSAVVDAARRRRAEAVAGEVLHARQRRARHLRWWRDEEGMVRLAGALSPDVGVAVVNRLERCAEHLRRQARAAGREEPFEAVAADALVALCDGGGDGGAGGRRAEVVFVCDVAAYRRGRAGPGEVCHVVGGGPVPASVVREAVAAGAFVKAVVHDGVRIDTIAHYGRRLPAVLRTALEVGAAPGFEGAVCAEEDCDRRYGLEWDHLDPVANGGLTSYANLKPRCWPHHRDKTDRDRRAGLLGPAAALRGPP